jgi:hypothetical protein
MDQGISGPREARDALISEDVLHGRMIFTWFSPLAVFVLPRRRRFARSASSLAALVANLPPLLLPSSLRVLVTFCYLRSGELPDPCLVAGSCSHGDVVICFG